jgi:hypothetical protein
MKVFIVIVAAFALLTVAFIINRSQSGSENMPLTSTIAIGNEDVVVTSNEMSEQEWSQLPDLGSAAETIIPLALDVSKGDDYETYSKRLQENQFANALTLAYGKEFFSQCEIDNCERRVTSFAQIPTPPSVVEDNPASDGQGAWFEVILMVTSGGETKESLSTWYLFRKTGFPEISLESMEQRFAATDGADVGDSANPPDGISLQDSNAFRAPGLIYEESQGSDVQVSPDNG